MRQHSRKGFTLLEVVIALVITGLVVTLAYAAVQGGIDTRDRLTRHRDNTETLVTVRSMIRDALRHAVPGVPGGPEVFSLVNRTSADGRAADSIAFLSRGVSAPYGTSSAWRVSVSVDSAGLHFAATPDGRSTEEAVSATAHGVTGLDVRTVGRGVVSVWTNAWSDPGVAPQAVALAIGDAGSTSFTPLVARLYLERMP